MSTVFYSSTRQRQIWRVIPDLIRARELLRDLVWKDLRARYRYAMMGFLWAVIEPLMFMALLAFVFSFMLADRASLTQSTQPFPVLLLCGLIFWQYFSTALNSAAHSVVDHKNLVKKVYFPREVIPLAVCCVPLVNLAIGFILLLLLHLILGGAVSVVTLCIPLLFILQFVLTLGLALIFACGHALFRDVGNLISVGMMFGFYASPVIYPVDLIAHSSKIPHGLYLAYMANPMAGLITAYRQILFEVRIPDWNLLIWPAVCAVGCFTIGLVLFRRTAPTMADYL